MKRKRLMASARIQGTVKGLRGRRMKRREMRGPAIEMKEPAMEMISGHTTEAHNSVSGACAVELRVEDDAGDQARGVWLLSSST